MTYLTRQEVQSLIASAKKRLYEMHTMDWWSKYLIAQYKEVISTVMNNQYKNPFNTPEDTLAKMQELISKERASIKQRKQRIANLASIQWKLKKLRKETKIER